jgi:heme/copper-type cytochrome/quinol oxidase subunit 2
LGKSVRYVSIDVGTPDNAVHLANIFGPISTPAQAILEVSWLVLWICTGIFVVVAGLLVYTIIRFRRRRADNDEVLSSC